MSWCLAPGACRLAFAGHNRIQIGNHAVDFFGHDGEPFACLACARRFDGGIQCQQVGLESDFVDGLADLGGFGGEILDNCTLAQNECGTAVYGGGVYLKRGFLNLFLLPCTG